MHARIQPLELVSVLSPLSPSVSLCSAYLLNRQAIPRKEAPYEHVPNCNESILDSE